MVKGHLKVGLDLIEQRRYNFTMASRAPAASMQILCGGLP